MASNRWSVCRYNSNNAWNYNWNGIVNANNFYNSLTVSAVSALVKNKWYGKTGRLVHNSRSRLEK